MKPAATCLIGFIVGWGLTRWVYRLRVHDARQDGEWRVAAWRGHVERLEDLQSELSAEMYRLRAAMN